jgi:hypothetical protein
MRQLGDVAAALARSARSVRLGAKQTLGEPKSEALLADPAGSLKQQARRERSGANALVQSLAQLFMSVKVDDRHVEIWSEQRRGSGGLCSDNGTFSDLNNSIIVDPNRNRR